MGLRKTMTILMQVIQTSLMR
uniref:Uncharacterized protein n=1 Tax=Arundo donax TaxID=35708 RepID=A0A0A9BXN3_ARUDO